jgi:hypothetical protein
MPKLESFFEGRRRKAFLVAWTHLKTKAGESRIKLDLRLPLLTESQVGMNREISDAFLVMAKDDSTMERSSLNVLLEGMTLDIFTTSDPKASKHPLVSSTGVRMVKLAIVQAAGEDEKREVNLQMTAYVPASIQLRDIAWEHLHSAFGIEAVYSQTEMDFEAEEESSEEEESEEEEELASAE